MDKIKFIVDVGVGKKVEKFLDQKYDVKCIREINQSMSDINILKIAEDENRIIITMDKDFGELAYKSKLSHSGILLLRLEDANGEEKLEFMKYIINHFEKELFNNFCVFDKNNFRVRKIQILI